MTVNRRTDYVHPAAVEGRFVLRDVTVVDVRTGARTAGQDLQIADGVVAGDLTDPTEDSVLAAMKGLGE